MDRQSEGREAERRLSVMEQGRETARRLKQMLDDVDFPIQREALVDRLRGRTLEIGPGNEIEPAVFLRDAPDPGFASAFQVADRLVAMGAIRARGSDMSDMERDTTAGTQGSEEGFESAFATESPEGYEHMPTAPPSLPSDTKGVRRPPE